MLVWELAYTRIAGVLTGLEAAAYHGHHRQPGGWLAASPSRVERMQEECAGVHSFHLQPADGQLLPAYQPGQFSSVSVEIPGHPHWQIRQYSLSDAPGRSYYRLTIKRQKADHKTPAGQVSNYLHDTMQTGATLLMHSPTGEFYLDDTAITPLVLRAGGVGITPLMAMLEHLLLSGSPREIRLLQAVRDADAQPFGQRLRLLAQRHPNLRIFTLYGTPAPVLAGNEEDADETADENLGYGLLADEHLDTLLADLPRMADCYCCDPLSFMRHVNILLRAQSFENRHFEVFGPAQVIKRLSE
ncbi:FAD-binding oxidoreductase [Hymenobacter sp. H14-R3]|uniref:FAD-binding oxidoreductase n=1 Tax=Hymenobacter sp. H14-R3 TaxID=3046308 RepID=UPI0024BA460C|nr:FAD-binding oxidoreductase [Hymenobacter sp. H14-R3]MDJ0367946.1 FAD-binding oxidoreductase [Hymenobacter sp. H14-R3]